MPPGRYSCCPAEQPSWRQWGAGGGEGAPAGVLGGKICPHPVPPAHPTGPASCGIPCASSPGHPARGSRTWTRVASSPQAEPPTPRRSRQCLRVCGVGGLRQDPHHAVDQGHCCRTAAGRWPETDLAQSGGSTLQQPLPPLQRVPALCGPCTLHHLGLGVARKCRSGPGRRLLLWSFPSLPSHLLSSSLQRDGDSEAFFSLLCQSWSEGERRGRSEGQHKAKGPAPLTRHRDKSDLFILVKKVTEQFCIAFGLTHKI